MLLTRPIGPAASQGVFYPECVRKGPGSAGQAKQRALRDSERAPNITETDGGPQTGTETGTGTGTGGLKSSTRYLIAANHLSHVFAIWKLSVRTGRVP
ncbi:unnamed protein product [Gadus morhua 'NCC']